MMSPGSAEYRGDQQVSVAVVDAGHGIPEDDGSVVREAGSEPQYALLAGGAGKRSGLQRADRGFPVDRRCRFAVVDEASEVVAHQPGAMVNDQPDCGFERAESFGSGPERGRQGQGRS
jgi:hypothetical protein